MYIYVRNSANTKGSLISKSCHDVLIFESWFLSWFRRPFARWRAFLARFSACPAMGSCVKSAGNLQNLIAFHYLGAPSCMVFHPIIIGKLSKGQPWFGVNHPMVGQILTSTLYTSRRMSNGIHPVLLESGVSSRPEIQCFPNDRVFVCRCWQIGTAKRATTWDSFTIPRSYLSSLDILQPCEMLDIVLIVGNRPWMQWSGQRIYHDPPGNAMPQRLGTVPHTEPINTKGISSKMPYQAAITQRCPTRNQK